MQQDSSNSAEVQFRWCPRCELLKATTEFYPQGGYCKPCRKVYDKERRAGNPNHRARQDRNNWLTRNYGISFEQYQKMLWDQNGLCAICGRQQHDHGKGGKLYVDHDHTTGQVRALLCHSCNTGLGHFEDDVGRMERAIEYINWWREDL